MSKVIVDSIQPLSGDTLNIQGDVFLSGSLNGVPVTVLTGNTTFTGNTSGNCTTRMYVDYLYGCDGQLNIGTNTIVDNKLTADYFYGDGSSLTNLTPPVFTGNTSGQCIQDLWVQRLEGCNGSVTVKDNLNVTGVLSATTFYGDSSNLRLSINNLNCPKCSTITPTITYMNYGLNVVISATTTDHCVRLPETPVLGGRATLINNSGFDIFVFPSVGQVLPSILGGWIAGKRNGSYKTASVTIPSNNIPYTFTCYDIADGGKWTGPLLANTNQYDSGVISIDTSGGGTFVHALDNNYKNIGDAGNYAWNAIRNSLTLPNIIYNSNPLSCGNNSSGLCATIYYKPTTPWQFINKITLYTNFSTGTTAYSSYFGLNSAYERSYYSAGTTSPTGYRGWNGGGNVGNPAFSGITQMIAGNASSSTYTNNPGDPGTWFGELTYDANNRPSLIGDFLLSSGTMYLGMPVNANVNADLYYSQYIGFIFETNRVSPDIKFRFLIDYTI